jgi:hypothetical protein
MTKVVTKRVSLTRELNVFEFDQNMQAIVDNQIAVALLTNQNFTSFVTKKSFADLPATGNVNIGYEVLDDADTDNNGRYGWNGTAYYAAAVDTTLQNNIDAEATDRENADLLKANIANPTFTGTVGGITKAMVGLGNVDNTSDANKPVSTPQANALALKIDKTQSSGLADRTFNIDANGDVSIVESVNSIFNIDALGFLNIKDESGNILATFDNDGLKIKKYNICDSSGSILATLDATKLLALLDLLENGSSSVLEDWIKINNQGVVNYIDESENVIFQINNKGIKTAEIEATKITADDLVLSFSFNSFKGKEFYTVFDSLGASGEFQAELSRLTGSNFSQEKNINPLHPLSIGGTQTRGTNEVCGQSRFKNLIDNYPNAEIVLYENVNDFNIDESQHGTITDEPFMLQNFIRLDDQGFTNSGQADTYFANNIATILASETPTKGTAIEVPFYVNGKNIQINTAPTSDGTLSIIIGGSPYDIAILSTDTIADVINKILEYNYGLVFDVQKDATSIDFSQPSGATFPFSYNANSTGITATITTTTTAIQYATRNYIGEANGTDWTNISKWTYFVTLYSAYKGMLAYACENLPTTDLYWFIPTRFSADTNSFKDVNGNLLIDEYLADAQTIQYQKIVDIQVACSELFNVKVLNIHKYGGINIFNLFTYYNINNVHPKLVGYNKWGLETFKLIK